MMTGTTSFRRLIRIGAIAIVVSALVNLSIRAISIQLFHLSPAFSPLGIGPVIFWSVICGIGAVLVFALVIRRSSNPVAMYLLIAISVYVFTFIPDALLLSRNPPLFPGTSIYAVLTLMSMHAAEAIIMTLTLTTPWIRSKSQTHWN
jgi:Family of unknown function (DUF6069)